MSGEELADAVGYSHQSAIGNLEGRATGSGGKKLHLIAARLRVSEEWLRYGPDSDDIPDLGAAETVAAATAPAPAAQVMEARDYSKHRPLRSALQSVDFAIKSLPPHRRPELAKVFDLYLNDPYFYGHLLQSIEAILSGEMTYNVNIRKMPP